MKKVEVTYEAAPLNESKTIEVNTVINEMQESGNWRYESFLW